MQTLSRSVRPKPDLLTDAARRLLRGIVSEHEHRAFAGDADSREQLVAGGYIEIVHRQGGWYRLRPTPKGFATAL
jgi:hypothetical protein